MLICVHVHRDTNSFSILDTDDYTVEEISYRDLLKVVYDSVGIFNIGKPTLLSVFMPLIETPQYDIRGDFLFIQWSNYFEVYAKYNFVYSSKSAICDTNNPNSFVEFFYSNFAIFKGKYAIVEVKDKISKITVFHLLFYRQNKTYEVLNVERSIFPQLPIYDKEIYSLWSDIKYNKKLNLSQEDILRVNKWGWFLTTESIKNLDKILELDLINGYTGEKFIIDIPSALSPTRTIQTNMYIRDNNLVQDSCTIEATLNFFKNYDKRVVKIILPRYRKEFETMDKEIQTTFEYIHKENTYILTYYIAWRMKDVLRELAQKLNFAYIYPGCLMSDNVCHITYRGVTNTICLHELVSNEIPKGSLGVCIYKSEVKICH